VLAGHLATFVVAARAAGSHASLLRLAPLMLLALLAMSLPVNVGGWGPREGSPRGRSARPASAPRRADDRRGVRTVRLRRGPARRAC
jgi:hypothetical protein